MGLVGLLTRASPNHSCLPKVSKLHLSGLLALTLGAYSGGAVPDSHRLPKSPSTSGYKPCPAKSQGCHWTLSAGKRLKLDPIQTRRQRTTLQLEGQLAITEMILSIWIYWPVSFLNAILKLEG